MSTVYVGNLHLDATAKDLQYDFDRYGRIVDIWVARNPPGFAFIEFEDERDARDAVRDMDGRDVMGKRVRVEISRRGRVGRKNSGDNRDTRDSGRNTSAPNRTRFTRTEHRLAFSGLPDGCDWKDLKEFISEVADAAFVDVTGRGEGFAEFMSASEADRAEDKLDGTRLRGVTVSVRKATSRDNLGGRDRGGRGGGGGGRDRFDRDDRRGRDRSRSRDREEGLPRRDRSRSADRRSRSADRAAAAAAISAIRDDEEEEGERRQKDRSRSGSPEP